jgi:hypothetical protein
MSTPSLKELLSIWRKVTKTLSGYLETLDTQGLSADLLSKGKSVGQSVGSAMHRVTYHYWYHIGEIQAVRQLLVSIKVL